MTNLKLIVVTAGMAMFGATATASTPEAWARLNARVDRACLLASGLKQAKNVFPRLSRSPGSIRSIAPQEVGEDNDEVLGALLGREPSKIEALRAQAII